MFIGVFKNSEDKIENYIYYTWREFLIDTKDIFAKDTKVLDFKLKGNTYEERKASLEELAKEWQSQFAQYNWSYGEYAEIETYFLENAKRYGLLKEFRENCIC